MNKEINWEKRYRELFVPKCGDDEVCNAFWQSNMDFISDLLEEKESLEKIQSKEFVSKSKKMYTKLDNLIVEIASMLESGTITVGALGLSQDSVDYIHSYEAEQKLSYQNETIKAPNDTKCRNEIPLDVGSCEVSL